VHQSWSLHCKEKKAKQLHYWCTIHNVDRIFKKKLNTMFVEWGKHFFWIFHPSNGRSTTEICACCVHGLMIQKMKKLMFFWMSIYGSRKRWSHLVKQFILDHEWTLASFLFMENGTTTCMHWKVEHIYEWYKEHKHCISNQGEKVRLTNKLASFVFFLPGFVISIARWVV